MVRIVIPLSALRAFEAVLGGYLSTRLESRRPTPGIAAFRAWPMDAFAAER